MSSAVTPGVAKSSGLRRVASSQIESINNDVAKKIQGNARAVCFLLYHVMFCCFAFALLILIILTIFAHEHSHTRNAFKQTRHCAICALLFLFTH